MGKESSRACNSLNKGQSVKERMIEALGDGVNTIEGRPDSPTIPLVGSQNVPISREEEKECE